MLNQSGITSVTGTTTKNILVAPELAFSLPCMVANTGVVADADSKKVVKAGTPLVGDITVRGTAFTAGTAATASGIAGLLLHDLDVTSGTKNAQILVFGFVDETKLDAAVQTIVDTAAVKTQLAKITFVK